MVFRFIEETSGVASADELTEVGLRGCFHEEKHHRAEAGSIPKIRLRE